MPTKLSLCMIVKNEERVLEQCLESISPWVDEIIIVDTGSTDTTKAIAAKYTKLIYDFPWIDDFSAARNESLKYATGDWIFWMDADDTISAEDGQQLRRLAAGAGEKVGGYMMNVVIPPPPGKIGFTSLPHVKLFRNLAEHRFYNKIHEQIADNIGSTGRILLQTNISILHSAHDFSPEGQKMKSERELRILQTEINEKASTPFTWFNLGCTQSKLGRYGEAASSFEKSIELAGEKLSSITHLVYDHLASAYCELGELDNAESTVRAGLHLLPNDPGLQFRAGYICIMRGKLKIAEQLFRTALVPRETYLQGFQFSIITHLGFHWIGVICKENSDLDQAIIYFLKALTNTPEFEPSLIALSEVQLLKGDDSGYNETKRKLENLAKK